MNEVQPHIRCGAEAAVRYTVLPGDPERVKRAGRFLTDVTELAVNREYKSIVGSYEGVRIMVMSTGMGGASTGIAVEELRRIGVDVMIRIGSCGALQPDIRLGDLIIANGAVRDEGASKAYIEGIYPAVPDSELMFAVIEAAKDRQFSYHVGTIRSHDSFYTDREDEIDRYWSSKGILGADMETAALFTIGALRGVKTASILNTVVTYQGNLEAGVNQYADGTGLMMQGEEHEILTAFETCVRMERQRLNK